MLIMASVDKEELLGLDVHFDGHHAYVAAGAKRFYLVDIRKPTNPKLVPSVDTPGEAKGVYTISSLAYVADGDSGLRVIDISSPTAPNEVGFFLTPTLVHDAAVSGDYAYVANHWDGLRVVDVSDSSSPAEAGFIDTPGLAYGVDLQSQFAYVADGDAYFGGGFRVVNVELRIEKRQELENQRLKSTVRRPKANKIT